MAFAFSISISEKSVAKFCSMSRRVSALNAVPKAYASSPFLFAWSACVCPIGDTEPWTNHSVESNDCCMSSASKLIPS